jgi:hypothetical protein
MRKYLFLFFSLTCLSACKFEKRIPKQKLLTASVLPAPDVPIVNSQIIRIEPGVYVEVRAGMRNDSTFSMRAVNTDQVPGLAIIAMTPGHLAHINNDWINVGGNEPTDALPLWVVRIRIERGDDVTGCLVVKGQLPESSGLVSVCESHD